MFADRVITTVRHGAGEHTTLAVSGARPPRLALVHRAHGVASRRIEFDVSSLEAIERAISACRAAASEPARREVPAPPAPVEAPKPPSADPWAQAQARKLGEVAHEVWLPRTASIVEIKAAVAQLSDAARRANLEARLRSITEAPRPTRSRVA